MTDAATAGSLERYLGNTIREIRLNHGLTIADVANLAGISRGMLSKIENAQTATSLEALSRRDAQADPFSTAQPAPAPVPPAEPEEDQTRKLEAELFMLKALKATREAIHD